MYYRLFGHGCQSSSGTCNCIPPRYNQPRNNMGQYPYPQTKPHPHSSEDVRSKKNIYIKSADFGGVVLPEGTDKRATFHVASLSLDTTGYKNILIQLAFSCNIIAERLKLRLRFQILRQESGQGLTVPVSAGILYYRDKVCSEANSFTLSVCDHSSAADKCCVYSVLMTIEEFETGGNAIIANPTLIATIIKEA